MPINVGALAGGFAETAGEQLLTYGVGVALSEALRPEATRLGQEAWSIDPTRAVQPLTAAQIVAEDVQQLPWGEGEAVQHGIDGPRFRAILGEVLNAPGVPELLTLWRRDAITDADFVHGMRKAKLEARWDAPLETLKTERLNPQVIATAVQRGVMHDPGLLPVGPPSERGVIEPMPVFPGDTLAEAAAGGYDAERLGVLARIVGLPPAPGELLQLVNRGEILEADYLRGISEGNTRNEWARALLTLKRRLLTPHEYAELHLRGWIDAPAMSAGAALSGMEPADTQLVFEMLGRPLNVHAVTTALARGGSYGGDYEGVPEPYNHALRQSNVRPEWGNLAYANRYTLPGAFVVRRLLADAVLTEAEGHELFLQAGWRPDLAEKAAAAYSTGPAAKADPHVTKAETQLWTTIHRSYVDAESSGPEAETALHALGVADHARAPVLALWDHEREIVRRSLTPLQIKKAFTEAKFTRDEALHRLERLGMRPADAGLLLDE